MNIYQKINEVRKLVDYVQKDKRVGEGGYLAVTHDAVTALTRSHFIAQAVVIVPSLVSSQTVLTGTATAKGIPFIRYEAKYRFEVVNADEPQDRFQIEIESHAMDQGDKAPGKALSYAKKYVVLKLLEIESGEEEEEREAQKPAEKITPSAGIKDALSKDEQKKVETIASTVIDFLTAERAGDAWDFVEKAGLHTEEKIYLWTFLNSAQKNTLKKIGQARLKYDPTTNTYTDIGKG